MPFFGTLPHAAQHQEGIGTDPLANYGLYDRVRHTLRTTNNASPTMFSGVASNVDNTLQTGHGWTFSNSGTGSSLNYTGDFILGSQCIKLVSNGTSSALVKSPRETAINLTGKMIRMWLKFDTASYGNISAVAFYVGSGATAFLNNGFTSIAGSAPNSLFEFAKSGEWVSFTFNPASFSQSITGTIDWTAIQDFQLVIKDQGVANQNATLLFGGIDFIPNDTLYPNGVVTLGFDNQWAGQYTYGLPKLQQYGYKGTFYPIVEQIGQAGFMTQAQLDQIATLGHEIAGFSYYIADQVAAGGFTAISNQLLYADFGLMKGWLHSKNYRGTEHMALPKGASSTTLLPILKQQWAAARITTPRSIETLPVADPYRLRAWSIAANASLAVTPNSTPGTAEWILDQIALYGGWLHIYTHDIVTSGATGDQTNQATFNTFVDYIASKGIPVRTVGDILGI